MSTKPFALAVLVGVACDTGAIAVPPPRPPSVAAALSFASGTRLEAVAWEADGAQLLRHFFDRERNEECAFVDAGVPRIAPGPVYYCLPLGAVIHDSSGSLALFADAQCTQPVALAPLTGTAAYIIDRPTDACAAPPIVRRAQAPRTLKPYALDAGRCRQLTASVMGQEAGEAVPLDAFVRGDERPTGTGARIVPLTLTAADGAQQVVGAWDRARNAATRVQDPGTRGDWRWFPSRIAFASGGSVLYSDAACASTVSTKIARDAVCPLGAAFAFDGVCGGGDFIELGPALDPATLRERDATDACVPASPGTLAFVRGDRILRSSFAAAYPVERGGDRVRLRGWSDGTTTPSWDTFVDVATNEACTPALASDGMMRCLPTATALLDYFADAACTIPAFERVVDECTDVAPGFVRVGDRAFQVTGATPLYQRSGKGCAKRPAASTSRGHTAEEVDVGRFSIVNVRR